MHRLALVIVLAACGRVRFAELTDGGSEAAIDAGGLAPLPLGPLAAGGQNTCELHDGREVWCWGMGGFGGNGDGQLTSSATPVRAMLPIGTYTSVAVGDGGSCAIRDDGTAYCWGWNVMGALGLGNASVAGVPALVPALDDVVEASIGYYFGCVRRASGAVECAGAAEHLGDGSVTTRSTFGPVTGVTDAISISSGDTMACALRATGSVTCWGLNDEGQLGAPGTGALPVAGPEGPYDAIAAGDKHTCALRGGLVECWGQGTDGQLGDGMMMSSMTPVRVADLDRVIHVVGLGQTSCALRDDRTVWCWGGNAHGELGDNSGLQRSVPGRVLLDDVVELSGHTSIHVCARTAADEVWCWGENSEQKIDTSGQNRPLPVRITGLP